jgi:hypothetical protein
MTGENLWPTPKSGTSVAKIKQLNEFLNHGNAVEADRIIDELNRDVLRDSEVLAEFRYQEGRRAFLDGDPKLALDRFSAASALRPESARYFAAEVESAVAAHLGSTPRIPAGLLARAHRFGSDEDVRFQLVRAFALEKEYQKAEEVLGTLSGPSKLKAETLYLAIKGDWAAALATANRGIAEHVDTRTVKFLKILRLRALLNTVTGGEANITVGGRPDLRVSDAVALRDATLELLKEAEASGWPANSEMLLDGASAICVIFGPDRELLNLLSDFAQKRPRLRDAQEALARVATFIGEPSTAIAALERVEDPDPADVARLVLLYSESGAHTNAVESAIAHLLDKPHETLIDVAVATAAVSAYRLGSTAEEERLVAYISGGDLAARSLHRFITDSLKHPENRQANIDRLWNDATRDGGNETLQDNLLQYLRPDREGDVDRILELCAISEGRRNLTEMEAGKFSAALLRRDRFHDIINFTARAEEFYPRDENVGLARAIALERIGQPAAAEQVLRRFDDSVRTDLVNARSQLLLRIGDIDAIVSLTKRALAAATDHADRFHYSRSLATLYSRGDRSQYVEWVWRLGEIADKDVEGEEGAFLLHFLMATAGDAVQVAPSRVQEFQERIKRFTEIFPESSILKVGHFPEDASPHDLLAQMQRIAGITDEGARAFRRAREIGERSGSHFPIAYRPRTYAPYASNIADLLRIVINAWHRGESSKLVVGDASFPLVKPSLPPILDLVTVVLLVELGLFDKLFSVWTAVAVPKESLAQLTELMFGPLDAGNSELLDRVVDAIHRHHSAIVQPGALGEDKTFQFPQGEFATIRSEVSSNRYEYLTFDLASIVMLSGDASIAGRCRTVWDFLNAGEIKGALSSTEAKLTRLRVASWNTAGTPLEPSDIESASLGAAGASEDDDSPAARAVKKYFLAQNPSDAIRRTSRVLVGLARSTEPNRVRAAEWFARLFYLEALLARSIGVTSSTDALTAQLALLAVVEASEEPNARASMEFVWRVLEANRTAFGGSIDRDEFFRLLGNRAAELFDGIVKRHGIDAMSAEAAFTDLLFSLTTTGTQDRLVLEEEYFKTTKALQAKANT